MDADTIFKNLDRANGHTAHEPVPASVDAETSANLRALLSVESWADRDIPEPDRLLGDLLTSSFSTTLCP